MLDKRLDNLDPAALGAPLTGSDPAGESLRYDPVFDQMKLARSADAEYLPQGIWQREVKRADWNTVADLAIEALRTRTKDLQIGAWLCEALAHLYGLRGLGAGLTVLRELSEQVWDEVFPKFDEDDEYEPRLLVLEWLDRQLPDAIDQIEITAPKTRLVEPVTLQDWREMERAERTAPSKPSTGARRAPAQDDAAQDGLTRGDLNTSIGLTPSNHYEALETEIGEAQTAMRALSGFYDEACEPGAARFPKTEEAFRLLRKYLDEARAQLAAATEVSEGAATESTPEQARKPSRRAASKQAPANAPAGPVDIVAEVGRITGRDQGYAVLEALAERLTELDPHSPAPYLARRAASFRDRTFADLVMHFIDDERMQKHLFHLLGIGEDAVTVPEEGGAAVSK